MTAARTLFERMRLSTGCFTAMDVTLMMRPHRRSFIPGSTARVSSTTLSRFCRTASCHASAEWLSKGPAGGPPPLVTSTSICPNAASAGGHHAPHVVRPAHVGDHRVHLCAGLARMASAVSRSAASPRAHNTSRAPSRPSSSATARPSPRLDAATSATFPVRPEVHGYFRWK